MRGSGWRAKGKKGQLEGGGRNTGARCDFCIFYNPLKLIFITVCCKHPQKTATTRLQFCSFQYNFEWPEQGESS